MLQKESLVGGGSHAGYLIAYKPPLLAISRPIPSTFACHGDSLDTRRCVFQDVVVQGGEIYYYITDPLVTTVPPMLCSMVNKPEKYAASCNVRVLSDPTAIATLIAQIKKTQHLNLGLALNRLNVGNAYHILFEDKIPSMAMIYNTRATAPSPTFSTPSSSKT